MGGVVALCGGRGALKPQIGWIETCVLTTAVFDRTYGSIFLLDGSIPAKW